jgi:hypothetical protein
MQIDVDQHFYLLVYFIFILVTSMHFIFSFGTHETHSWYTCVSFWVSSSNLIVGISLSYSSQFTFLTTFLVCICQICWTIENLKYLQLEPPHYSLISCMSCIPDSMLCYLRTLLIRTCQLSSCLLSCVCALHLWDYTFCIRLFHHFWSRPFHS